MLSYRLENSFKFGIFFPYHNFTNIREKRPSTVLKFKQTCKTLNLTHLYNTITYIITYHTFKK